MAYIQRIENKKGPSYKIRVSRGYSADGKKLTATTTFTPEPQWSEAKALKEAQKFAYDFESKVHKGLYHDGEKVLFETYALNWLEGTRGELTYHTHKSYGEILRSKIIPYFKAYKLAAIRLPVIEAFYSTLAEAYTLSSIKKYQIILNGIFKTALRHQLIAVNPCAGAKLPKAKKGAEGIAYFTPEQALAFLDSLDMSFDFDYKAHGRTDDTGKPYSVGVYTQGRGVPLQSKCFTILQCIAACVKGRYWRFIGRI